MNAFELIEQLGECIDNPSTLADVISELAFKCWEDSDQTSEARVVIAGAIATAQHRVLTFIEEPEE